MNDSTVMVAVISLIGTVIGSVAGVLVSNKLTTYRIEQLERKLDKYAEKQDNMNTDFILTKRDLETAFVRIDELRSDIRK